MASVVEKRVTLEVHSQLVRQKLNDGLDARGIPEEQYLIQNDEDRALFKVPYDVYDMIRTNSDFKKGVDYKVVGRVPRKPRKAQPKPGKTIEQIVAGGFSARGTKNLRTPTA
jgi:hypothetical protein